MGGKYTVPAAPEYRTQATPRMYEAWEKGVRALFEAHPQCTASQQGQRAWVLHAISGHTDTYMPLMGYSSLPDMGVPADVVTALHALITG